MKKIFSIIVIFIFSLTIYNCKKDKPSEMPTVSTVSISENAQTTAICGGNITSDGGADIEERGVCWSTEQNPTINNSKTNDGIGTGIYSSLITGLTPNTRYYVRAYATNISGTSYGDQISFCTKGQTGTVTDIDGNIYNTIQIGTQTWMTENLKVTHYRDGTPIPLVPDSISWMYINDGYYAYYNNDTNNIAKYGLIYNWYAAFNSHNIAPTGWHIPSDAEWDILINYVGGEMIAGGKLKEKDTTHWETPNTGATDENGFRALPGGYYSYQAKFLNIRTRGDWWTVPIDSSMVSPKTFMLEYDQAYICWAFWGLDRQTGVSIRCVKD